MPPLTTLLLTPSFLILFITTLLIAASLRILTLFRSLTEPPTPRPKKGDPSHLLIILGSGGHTQEMLYMLENLKSYKWTFRTWVVSSKDWGSSDRARAAEKELEKSERGLERYINATPQEVPKEDGWPTIPHHGPGTFQIFTVPRARNVYQSVYTTPLSALRCLWGCLKVLLGFAASSIPRGPGRKRHVHIAAPTVVPDLPDVIFCNGPATAVLVVLAAWILKFFNIRGAQSRGKMKIVYVETFARVKHLSLTGRLLLFVADWFYVQWPELDGIGGRARYTGNVVLP